MKKILLLLSFLLILSGCGRSTPHAYTFYYWKTRLALKPGEAEALQKAGIPVLYTRFFDVDKTYGKIQPVGVITRDSSFRTAKKIVPVVFITNRSFTNIRKDEIELMSSGIWKLVQQKCTDYGFGKPKELQIDCDWTSGTSRDYFEFLKKLRQTSKIRISCTLRLHQVKDKAQTGIPPVGKVYLMCYSTSSPLDNSEKNSILDVNVLKSYLSGLQNYPLKNMDVALPIYSWGIVTNHQGKHKIINALRTTDLDGENFKKISDHEAVITQDGFYFGNYLNKGFTVKIEEVEEEQLRDVTSFIDKKLTNYNIVYYQLDDQFVNHRNLTY